MSRVQVLRALVSQRLRAAAEDIFGLLDGTIAEFEEELRRSREQEARHRRILEALLSPRVQLIRTDTNQPLLSKEEDPPTEQQEQSPHVDQEDPGRPPIKEEQEEVWSSPEREKPQGPDEDHINKVIFTRILVKSEDDEEEAQSSQLQQIETGAEPERESDQERHLGPVSEDNLTATDGSDDEQRVRGEDQSSPTSVVMTKSKRLKANKTSHRCSECGKMFERKINLARHMRIHTGEKPFGCPKCGKRFNQKASLTTHMSIHIGVKPFSCSVCGKKFGQKHNLIRHKVIHTGEKPFGCSECGKRYRRKHHLTKHMLVHTGEKPFGCSQCGKRFNHKDNLKLHVAHHRGEKLFSCSRCHQRFFWSMQLKKHLCFGSYAAEFHRSQAEENRERDIGADGEKRGAEKSERHLHPEREAKAADSSDPESHKVLTADVQQLLVSKEELLLEPQDPSPNQEDTECPLIKEEQDDMWSRQEGEQLQGSKVTKFILPPAVKHEADEERAQSSELHQRLLQAETEVKIDDSSYAETEDQADAWMDPGGPGSHLNFVMSKGGGAQKEPKICFICGKTFSHKTNMKRHMKCHTGEKPFSCAFCSKRFNRKEHLTSHMRCHTGEKPYSCSLCDARFSHRCGLDKHTRLHTGEKPFSCSLCGKNFRQHSDLTVHMRVHSGEKPFSCLVCDASFSHRYTLAQHMKTHTRVSPFICSVCGRSYSRKEHLVRHTKAHAREKPPGHGDCGDSFSWESRSFDQPEPQGEVTPTRAETHHQLAARGPHQAPQSFHPAP